MKYKALFLDMRYDVFPEISDTRDTLEEALIESKERLESFIELELATFEEFEEENGGETWEEYLKYLLEEEIIVGISFVI
jgi:hypothetical protein